MARIVYKKGDLEAIKATFKVEKHFSHEDEDRFQLIEEKELAPVKRENGGGGPNSNGGGARGGGEQGSLSTSSHHNHSTNANGGGGSGLHNNHLSNNGGGGGSFGNHNIIHHHHSSNTHNSRGGEGNHNRMDRRDHRRQLNDRFSLPQRAGRASNRDEEAFEAGYLYELERNEAHRKELQATMEKEEKKHQQDRQQTEDTTSSVASDKERKGKESDELDQFLGLFTEHQPLPAAGGIQPAKKSRFFQSGTSAVEPKSSETNGPKNDLIWGSSSPTSSGRGPTAGDGAVIQNNKQGSGDPASAMSNSNSGLGRRADPNASPLSMFTIGDEKDARIVAEVREGVMNLPASFHQCGIESGASSANPDSGNEPSKTSASENSIHLAQLFLSATSATQRSQGQARGSSGEGAHTVHPYVSANPGSVSNGMAGGSDKDGNGTSPSPGAVWNVHDVELLLLQQRSGNGSSRQRGDALPSSLEGKAISASDLESRLIQQARQQNSRNSSNPSAASPQSTAHSSTEGGSGMGSSFTGSHALPSPSSSPSCNILSPTVPSSTPGTQTKLQGGGGVGGSSTTPFTLSGISLGQSIQTVQQQHQSAAASRYVQQGQPMPQWGSLQYQTGVNMSKMPVAPGGGGVQNGTKLPPGSTTSWNSASPFLTYGYAAPGGVNGVLYSNPQPQVMYVTRSIPPFSTSANPSQYALFTQQQQQSRTQLQPGQQK